MGRLGLMIRVDEGDVRLEIPDTLSKASIATVQKWLERQIHGREIPEFSMNEWNWRHAEGFSGK